jgi:hypothetical protein
MTLDFGSHQSKCNSQFIIISIRNSQFLQRAIEQEMFYFENDRHSEHLTEYKRK